MEFVVLETDKICSIKHTDTHKSSTIARIRRYYRFNDERAKHEHRDKSSSLRRQYDSNFIALTICIDFDHGATDEVK